MRSIEFFKLPIAIVAVATIAAASQPATAQDVFKLTLKDHSFAPDVLQVPANTRFRIEVENRDQTPAEFESSQLKVEKIVVGGGKITVYAGPLKPGTYPFFDDYRPDQAKGVITAVQQ